MKHGCGVAVGDGDGDGDGDAILALINLVHTGRQQLAPHNTCKLRCGILQRFWTDVILQFKRTTRERKVLPEEVGTVNDKCDHHMV